MAVKRVHGFGYAVGVAGICLMMLPLAMGATGADWLAKVPPSARAQKNPLAHEASAAGTGKTIYREYCAQCHGAQAQGMGSFPSLRTAVVRHATDGDLQWLLTNGDLVKGMPAWSALPVKQRWELVSYIRSLPPQK